MKERAKERTVAKSAERSERRELPPWMQKAIGYSVFVALVLAGLSYAYYSGYMYAFECGTAGLNMSPLCQNLPHGSYPAPHISAGIVDTHGPVLPDPRNHPRNAGVTVYPAESKPVYRPATNVRSEPTSPDQEADCKVIDPVAGIQECTMHNDKFHGPYYPLNSSTIGWDSPREDEYV